MSNGCFLSFWSEWKKCTYRISQVNEGTAMKNEQPKALIGELRKKSDPYNVISVNFMCHNFC